MFDRNTFSHLTVQKKSECYPQNVFANPIYLIYMYKEDLALNNLQWFICNKSQPNQILSI